MPIDTTPNWDGKSGYQTFGVTSGLGVFYGATAIGQVFRSYTGGSTALTSFNCYLSKTESSSDISYELYIMAWNAGEQQPTGSILFQSSAQSTSGLPVYVSGSNNNYGEVQVSISGATLMPDTQYIAFLTTLGLPQTGVTGVILGAVYTSIGGLWFFPNTGIEPTTITVSDLTAYPWVSAGGTTAFAFTADP